MPGAFAANAYQGARSEHLAVFVFSAFGSAVQLPRESDHGLDLACTLIEHEGKRARPYAYYSVQVKSDEAPWEFKNSGAIKWLLTYPAPLLFCIAGKAEARFRIYHITQRFHAGARTDRPANDYLAVVPGRRADGQVPISWDEEGRLYLGDPILDFSIEEILETENCNKFGKVLDYWVTNDMRNLVRQQMGMRASSGPSVYFTNEPPPLGFGTFGVTEVSDEVCQKAKLIAAEHLEWLGQVLLRRNDKLGALLAGLAVRHLIPDGSDPRKLGFDPSAIYSALRNRNLPTGSLSTTWLSEALETLLAELRDRT
jgi:hypothetical protein